VIIRLFLRVSKVSMRANRGKMFSRDCVVMRTRPRPSDYVARCGESAKHCLHIKLSHIIIRRYKTISELMLNEQIRDKEIRLIGDDGEQLGIMSAKDALKMAKEAGLDLVKIAPTAKPPVCKIVDYGKYRYEQTRREKEAKKKQKTTEVKEIQLSPNIDVNDLTTKANQARKFLEKGNKVKVALRFRGREMAHMATGKEVLDTFLEKVSDVAVVEKPAKLEGRSMIMVLAEKR